MNRRALLRGFIATPVAVALEPVVTSVPAIPMIVDRSLLAELQAATLRARVPKMVAQIYRASPLFDMYIRKSEGA